MSAEEAAEAARAWILRTVDGPTPTVEPWPEDVPDHTRPPVGERERRPAMVAHKRPEPQAPPLSTWDEKIPPTTCDPSPSVVGCGITSFVVPRDPPGMSHRVPPSGAEVVTAAHVLASLEVCRAAVERMGRRVVSLERMLAPAVTAAPLPVVPELVTGADAAARRETIDRVAVLIRGTVELAGLLATAPPDVAARGRAALSKVALK
jgi:hypothetical protein